MSDPSTARTEDSGRDDSGRDDSGRDDSGKGETAEAAPRPDPLLHPGRRVTTLTLVRASLIAAGLVTAYYLLPLDGTDSAGTAALLACGLLAVVVLFLWEVRTIARSSYPRLRAAEALAATLTLFLVLFAGTYFLLEQSTPGSFSEPLTRTDALYFTLTTFSTVGFGDITARSQAGRVVIMLQMAGGLVLVGVFARILAHAVQTGLRRQSGRPPGDGR
ncbi:potassium channel family protein [Streptomyces sp. NPDC053367]|uniref:potassium channel family protein n=1 Tax=Streptomyces sp. NPDC053367 TaxID=3365700 RepID=UPI0037CE8E5C